MEALHDAAGIKKMVMVPYPGAGPAAQALVSGQVKHLMSTPSSITSGFVKDGKIRMLGVASPRRSPLLPDVPSITESVPGFSVDIWFGFVAKTGTSPQVIARFNDAMTQVLADPDVQQKLRGVYVLPQAGNVPLTEYIRSDHAMWIRTIKAHNISID